MAGSTRKQVKKPANFLEALQGLGREVVSDVTTQVSQAVNSDIPASFGLDAPQLPTSGSLKPNESFTISDILAAEKRGEYGAEQRFNARLHQNQEQDRIQALRREEEAKKQMEAIQADIHKLSQSLGSLGKEAQIATLQAPVNPGIYHKNFFEQLRSFIQTLRKKVQDSRHWLHTQNTRAKKRQGFYWANVKKSGTKYMLSSERYMVTTTG